MSSIFAKKIVGIIIFLKHKTLINKLNDTRASKNKYCIWGTNRPPKQKVDRIYFAVDGKVKGYFKIFKITENEIRFYPESWQSIENGSNLKIIEGWRYYKE